MGTLLLDRIHSVYARNSAMQHRIRRSSSRSNKDEVHLPSSVGGGGYINLVSCRSWNDFRELVSSCLSCHKRIRSPGQQVADADSMHKPPTFAIES